MHRECQNQSDDNYLKHCQHNPGGGFCEGQILK